MPGSGLQDGTGLVSWQWGQPAVIRMGLTVHTYRSLHFARVRFVVTRAAPVTRPYGRH